MSNPASDSTTRNRPDAAAYDGVVATAREYYNSEDADNFYYHVWGGEDIHIGLYESDLESIRDASHRTVRRIASKLPDLGPRSRVLDVGGGYGGAMRFLAREYGCRCVVLNLSEVENERDRQMNREQGLDGLIEVDDGSFEDLPYEDNSFEAVWSQDAILHSGRRERVLAEVARVLKPGGHFVFTDPMQDDQAPSDQLQPVYDRIHLESLGSPGFYRQAADRVGMETVEFEDHSGQLPTHYGRVRAELESRGAELVEQGIVSEGYIERMKTGLGHWIDNGRKGHLRWGIFVMRKPA